MKLSQGTLQSLVPEHPESKHKGDRGKKTLPVNQEETLSRTVLPNPS